MVKMWLENEECRKVGGGVKVGREEVKGKVASLTSEVHRTVHKNSVPDKYTSQDPVSSGRSAPKRAENNNSEMFRFSRAETLFSAEKCCGPLTCADGSNGAYQFDRLTLPRLAQKVNAWRAGGPP